MLARSRGWSAWSAWSRPPTTRASAASRGDPRAGRRLGRPTATGAGGAARPPLRRGARGGRAARRPGQDAARPVAFGAARRGGRAGRPVRLPRRHHRPRMLRLAESAGVPAVLTNAVRYLDPADHQVGDVLDAARQLVPLHPRHLDAPPRTPTSRAARRCGRWPPRSAAPTRAGSAACCTTTRRWPTGARSTRSSCSR